MYCKFSFVRMPTAVPVDGRTWLRFSQPVFLCVNGTVPLTSSGRAKNDSEVVKTAFISSMLTSVSVSDQNPSVSAALTSWVVISSTRLSKSAKEIRGIVLLVYFIDAIFMKCQRLCQVDSSNALNSGLTS